MGVPSRAPEIIVGNVVPLAFATIMVLARIYSKAAILGSFQLDDYILTLSYAIAVVDIIIACASTRIGEGMHQWDIDLATLPLFFKTQYVSRIFTQAAFNLTKISLGFTYLRIFGRDKSSKVFLWGVIGILVASFIGLELTNIFQCNPVSAVWDFSEHGKCLNDVVGFWISVAVNLITNVALLLFSAWKIKGLHMPLRQKIVLMLTVGIGWITVVASIVRAVRIAAVIKDSNDASWRTYDTSIWTAVEICVALFCCSAPSTKPLLQKIAPSFMGSSYGGTASNTGPTAGKSTLRVNAKGTGMGTVDDKGNGAIVRAMQVDVSHEMV